jgi:hypothetical protein
MVNVLELNRADPAISADLEIAIASKPAPTGIASTQIPTRSPIRRSRLAGDSDLSVARITSPSA